MEEMIVILAWGLCIFAIIVMFVAMGKMKQKQDQLRRYWDIEIGMSEDEMLDIMGEGFNRSLLKNGRTKYEWRINATSYGHYTKGFSTRTYSGVHKVTIYTKNGLVEEVKSHNVD